MIFIIAADLVPRRYPAALFHSPPDGSTAHYLLDGPLALFPTLDSLGLLDNFETLRANSTDTLQVLRRAVHTFS